jgi:undecaprenyl pyrophosphate phosphatase UppP
MISKDLKRFRSVVRFTALYFFLGECRGDLRGDFSRSRGSGVSGGAGGEVARAAAAAFSFSFAARIFFCAW